MKDTAATEDSRSEDGYAATKKEVKAEQSQFQLLPALLLQKFQPQCPVPPTRSLERQECEMPTHDGTSFERGAGEAASAFSFMEVGERSVYGRR